MQSAPKSLPEMNAGERYAMMNTVSEALFDAAEHAAEEGDVRLAENFRAMAAMIEGESGDSSSNNFRPLELILRQSMTLLQLYMEKTSGSRMLH
ncbi:hypothetical protein [Agrobacterium larrymoorei]|uniref:Uncharacterized protein n=1 Tax=Agrobacterium larrymoorei TaxID=160699 RepID=A0ABU0UEK0_9HYPH|nr:hypothetical protein [Agrobacterium larrymoorei]MDQ1183364.1 hypothetical protein [Agrobacterium larrymoorei]